MLLIELEWVMRGYYGFGPDQISQVFGHLLSRPHVQIEERAAVDLALDHYAAGLGFADALHHASYRQCEGAATFDDRRFAHRAQRMGLLPTVSLRK